MSDASIANWLTFGLGAVTAWMAIATQRMAAATRKMAALEAQPYLAFVAMDLNQKMKEATAFQPERPDGLQPSVRFRNPGRVRITYDVHEIDFIFEGKHYPAKNFANHLGVIHPDETASFIHPVVPTDFVIAPGMSGQLGLKVVFWATPDSRQTLSLRLRFDLGRVEGKIHISYLFLEGPDYS
jgi:hypothetical protein